MTLRRALVAALVASAVTPSAVVRHGPTVCLFRVITGRPCPSCGLTRSWNAMGHLRPTEAVRFHPLGPATFIAALAIAAGGDGRLLDTLNRDGWGRRAWLAFGGFWIVTWLWRLTRTDG